MKEDKENHVLSSMMAMWKEAGTAKERVWIFLDDNESMDGVSISTPRPFDCYDAKEDRRENRQKQFHGPVDLDLTVASSKDDTSGSRQMRDYSGPVNLDDTVKSESLLSLGGGKDTSTGRQRRDYSGPVDLDETVKSESVISPSGGIFPDATSVGSDDMYMPDQNLNNTVPSDEEEASVESADISVITESQASFNSYYQESVIPTSQPQRRLSAGEISAITDGFSTVYPARFVSMVGECSERFSHLRPAKSMGDFSAITTGNDTFAYSIQATAIASQPRRHDAQETDIEASLSIASSRSASLLPTERLSEPTHSKFQEAPAESPQDNTEAESGTTSTTASSSSGHADIEAPAKRNRDGQCQSSIVDEHVTERRTDVSECQEHRGCCFWAFLSICFIFIATLIGVLFLINGTLKKETYSVEVEWRISKNCLYKSCNDRDKQKVYEEIAVGESFAKELSDIQVSTRLKSIYGNQAVFELTSKFFDEGCTRTSITTAGIGEGYGTWSIVESCARWDGLIMTAQARVQLA